MISSTVISKFNFRHCEWRFSATKQSYKKFVDCNCNKIASSGYALLAMTIITNNEERMPFGIRSSLSISNF